MKCKKCPEGRRFAAGSIECLLYGMIIREDHEGTREGCKQHDGDEDHGGEQREGAGLYDDGWAAVDRMQGIL